MAGGTGSRLAPLTKSVNKQLLPIFDKPLIYYPLSTLMLAGIRNILIITSSDHINAFKHLLGDGSNFGITLEYVVQNNPQGIAQGLILAEEILSGERVAMILGDNLFHGAGLGRQLSQYQDVSGAQIFVYPVTDPENYGVVSLDENQNPLSIEEKPQNPLSNLAVTGLYFYDQTVFERTKLLSPSARGELEISDLNRLYLDSGELHVNVLPRGTVWLDTGSFSGIHDAASYVRILQERQNLTIGSPIDVALEQGWIA